MKGRSVKRTMVAMALAVATTISGMAGYAHAFSFNDGDLVLAIYGNNTEALYDLGTASSLLTNPSTTIDVSAGLSAAAVGTNPVKYTVLGFNLGSTQVFTATTSAPGAINTGAVSLNNTVQNIAAWQNLASSAVMSTPNTLAKSDPGSFSSGMDAAGTGTLGGTWPVPMQGGTDQVLNVLGGDFTSPTNAFTQVGRVLLTSAGQLTIGNPGPGGSPVPLPAGIVLFGTGVIGLIGVARRSLGRMAA